MRRVEYELGAGEARLSLAAGILPQHRGPEVRAARRWIERPPDAVELVAELAVLRPAPRRRAAGGPVRGRSADRAARHAGSRPTAGFCNWPASAATRSRMAFVFAPSRKSRSWRSKQIEVLAPLRGIVGLRRGDLPGELVGRLPCIHQFQRERGRGSRARAGSCIPQEAWPRGRSSRRGPGRSPEEAGSASASRRGWRSTSARLRPSRTRTPWQR